MGQSQGARSAPWYNPKTWSKRTWIITVTAIAIIIVAVIVIPVEVTKATAYPSYTSLNYTLSETYSADDL